MNWTLTIYNRDGDTIAARDYGNRNDARAHMREIPEVLENAGDSYWFGDMDSLTLIRYEDFSEAIVTRIEASDE